MRMVLKLALLASSVLPAAAIAASPAPLMHVTIRPAHLGETAGKGDVDMTLAIPDAALAAGAKLHIGTIVPGMARALVVDGMSVADEAGPLPVVADDKNGAIDWTLSRATRGTVTIRYHVAVENVPMLRGGPPVQPRIDGDSVSSQGDGLIVSTGIERPYRIALQWDLSAMQPGAEGVSSYGNGNVEIPAGPIARLGDIVLMAGNHISHSPERSSGAFSAVWGAQPPFDPRASMEWTAKLHAWMSGFWQDKTEPPYRVFLRYNPMNAGGGAALIHSFIMTYGTGVTGESWKSILGHEMTHTWTANENEALGKWYTEGDAVYYQALLPWRAGLFSDAEYLADLNLTASRYYTDAMRGVPEDQVLAHFWEDTRIRVLPYDRGAMYFAVLNGKIRRASNGSRSIDDLVRVMNARRDAGETLTEADWLDLLRKEIGEEGPAVHRTMMAGGLMVPESDDFGPCFHRVVKQIRRFDLGFDNASILGDRKIIKGLKSDSEAAKAGLRDGDEISYGVALDAVQAEVGRTLTLQVTRDGKTFPITYLPRGEAVDAYQWERTPGVPHARCNR
jgi:predicted metalloprotease with PDZ domain